MAEPARQLPDDLDEELIDDPDVIDIRDQLAQEADDPDVIDIRDQLQNQDQPYTKERHEQNVNDIKEFFGKNEPKEEAKQPDKEGAKTDQPPATEDAKAPPPEAPPVTPPPKPGETEPAKTPADSQNVEAASNAADKVKAGKGKFGQIMNKVQQGKRAAEAGKDIKENGKEYAKEVAKEEAKKAAKQYAKQIARQAGAAIKKAAVQLISKNPYFWAIVGGIILLIGIIVAVIFIIHALTGGGGKGPAQYPTTALQQQQATFLLAISDDEIAKDTIVKDVIDSELERYDRIITNTKEQSSNLTASAQAKKEEFAKKLDSILLEQDVKRRKQIRDDIRDQMTAFENTLPFGKWITKLATDRVGENNTSFCLITKAAANVACASFTSTVLYLAGVPNAVVPSVDQVWRNSATQIVAPRPAGKSSNYYKDNLGKLRPGDIIFWGDGACSPKGSVLFDHVGFYVGNGQAVDTSSSEKIVKKRQADRRDSCRVFNGAKRYGR